MGLVMLSYKKFRVLKTIITGNRKLIVMSNKQKFFPFFFKVAATCLVLVIAAFIIVWTTEIDLKEFVKAIAAIGFIFLVVGIVFILWEGATDFSSSLSEV